MNADSECIFCKIIAGEIPSFMLFEDEQTFAFMDINPANEGHCLVIPKVHAENLFELDLDSAAAMGRTAQRVASAVQAVLQPEGLNLVQANGPAAAQSVMHVHVHVLPRRRGDDLALNWPMSAGDIEAIGALAERIRAVLRVAVS